MPRAAPYVAAGRVNVTNDLHIYGRLFWHGREWGPNDPTLAPSPLPTPMPTSFPTPMPTITPPSTCVEWKLQGSTADGSYVLTSPVDGSIVHAWCDMNSDGGGWTLVAISNGASYDSAWNFDPSAPGTDFSGEYSKDLQGRSFTAQRYECGTSSQGVRGKIVQTGTFTWPAGGVLSASGVATTSSNVVWIPRIPGDVTSDTDSDSYWTNHWSGVHFPNFGYTGFPLVDGRNWGTRYAFTCNPQSSAYGTGDTAWFGGASGTRFVRYWLK